MGYTPNIYIILDDLKKVDTQYIYIILDDLKKVDTQSEKLKDWKAYNPNTKKGFAMNEIRNAYNSAIEHGASLVIKGIEIIIIQSDLSGRNNDIRNMLSEMNVEYYTH